MRKTEGFDVFLKPRGYGSLVTPELVTLQIRFHPHEEVLDLCELWVCNLGNLLAVLSPLIYDTVEEKDELLREVRDISTGLSRREDRGGGRKSTMGQVLVEWELCVDLEQFLSRVLVFIQLRPEHVE